MGLRCRYNRYVTFRLVPLCFAGLLAFGCASQKNIQNEAAVRQGIIKYLNTKSDLAVSAMDMEVKAVTFRQNEADATVSFRPKGADASAGMDMRYTLERKGDEWVVKGKGSGSDSHGAMPPAGMQMPPAGASKLPEGHPPMGAAMPAPATPKK
jgi:hypothetical protein